MKGFVLLCQGYGLANRAVSEAQKAYHQCAIALHDGLADVPSWELFPEVPCAHKSMALLRVPDQYQDLISTSEVHRQLVRSLQEAVDDPQLEPLMTFVACNEVIPVERIVAADELERVVQECATELEPGSSFAVWFNARGDDRAGVSERSGDHLFSHSEGTNFIAKAIASRPRRKLEAADAAAVDEEASRQELRVSLKAPDNVVAVVQFRDQEERVVYGVGVVRGAHCTVRSKGMFMRPATVDLLKKLKGAPKAPPPDPAPICK
eukprot:gene8519-10116_t